MYNHICSESQSPVVVFTPQQHQFHHISSAAHSINLPPSKPVMDRRPYDIPLNNASATKRSHAEVDVKEKGFGYKDVHGGPTPMSSPEEGTGLVSRGSSIALNARKNPLSRDALTMTPLTDGNASPPPSEPESSDSLHRRKVSRHQSAADVGDGPLPAVPQAVTSDVRDQPDPYTLALGVGWRLPDPNPTAVEARRGHAAYIIEVFHLNMPSIEAVNEQNARVLVVAGDGWYLFDEDLTTGQMLAKGKEQALQNLRHVPPIFEGGVLGQQKVVGHSSGQQEITPPRESDDSDCGMVVGEMEM